jgi:hypothetical protein
MTVIANSGSPLDQVHQVLNTGAVVRMAIVIRCASLSR